MRFDPSVIKNKKKEESREGKKNRKKKEEKVYNAQFESVVRAGDGNVTRAGVGGRDAQKAKEVQRKAVDLCHVSDLCSVCTIRVSIFRGV